MTSLGTVSRVYARALFELAKSSQQRSSWLETLGLLATVISEPKVKQYILHPSMDADQKAQGLVALLDGECDVDATLQGFVQLLSHQGRLLAMPGIFSVYHALVLEEERIRKVVVYGAFPIDDHHLDGLTQGLQRRFGGVIDVTYIVDPELIGGVRIELGDQVLDCSVRGQLDSLHAALKN